MYLPNSRLSAIFREPGSGTVQLGPGRECVTNLPNSRLSAIFREPGSGTVQLQAAFECVTNLPNSRKTAIYWVVFRTELGRTGRPGNSGPEAPKKGQNSAKYFSPGLLTSSMPRRITRSCRLNCTPEKERKYAIFYTILASQDPDHLDVPPAPVWRLKLPNSWKT